jgi:hypothetical protein
MSVHPGDPNHFATTGQRDIAIWRDPPCGTGAQRTWGRRLRRSDFRPERCWATVPGSRARRVSLLLQSFVTRRPCGADGAPPALLTSAGESYKPLVTMVAFEEGTVPVVVGASPSCCAMMAASTTWRSEESMANGPPATGTCQTWVIIGVVPLAWVVPGRQG